MLTKWLVSAAALLVGTTVFGQQAGSSLHLQRRITDPLSGTTTVVDEYVTGNRLVSTTPSRTVIVDYASSQITIIDRAQGNYSVATFEQLAASRPAPKSAANEAKALPWKRTDLGAVRVAGRSGSDIELRPVEGAELSKIRLVLDDSVELTADQFGALTGSRYPGFPDASARAIENGARHPRSNQKSRDTFALPLRIDTTYTAAGDEITTTNEVLAVSNDEPSPRLLEIPLGALRVEAPFLLLKRELDAADHPQSH